MKYLNINSHITNASNLIMGCMRYAEMTPQYVAELIHLGLDNGVNFFDHADIYGNGKCESVFGDALTLDKGIKREDLYIQSKCGIRPDLGIYDLSKEHIINSVDNILNRLKCSYLDALLFHRPDALIEYDEVKIALEQLKTSGKVKSFGVCNHNPSQIELLKKLSHMDISINQMQLSLAMANMIQTGLEVNMQTEGAINRDGYILDYCRLNNIKIQVWSPLQIANWQGSFLNNPEYSELNNKLNEFAYKYNVTPATVAIAWLIRHPANMQIIIGSGNKERLANILKANSVNLSKIEWYDLYKAAKHSLP